MKRNFTEVTSVASSLVWDIPLVDAMTPSVFGGFQRHFTRTKLPKRSILASLTIHLNYRDEVTPTFRSFMLTPTDRADAVADAVAENLPVRITGDYGCNLIWTGKEVRVNVEVATLDYILRTREGTATSNTDFAEWYKNMSWNSQQCVVGYNNVTGWRGVYAENRLWKSLANYTGDTITDPVPSVIRSWYPQKVLQDIIKSVGLAKIKQILAIMKTHSWKGCPDLVLWNQNGVIFVEVKSSTDCMRPDQEALMENLTTAGFSYHIAITHDRNGLRRMSAAEYKKRKLESDSDSDRKEECSDSDSE